jgi:hypothetical protein
VYQALTKGVLFALIVAGVISLIMISIIYLKKQFNKRCRGNCLGCGCNKKS